MHLVIILGIHIFTILIQNKPLEYVHDLILIPQILFQKQFSIFVEITY